MENHYFAWIQQNYPNTEMAKNQCDKATTAMMKEFPELTRVRGHVIDGFAHKHEHWWLATQDGSIVDPTAIQFSGILGYQPLDESQPQPIGKCRECGDYVYPNPEGMTEFCSNKCSKAYMSYLNNIF